MMMMMMLELSFLFGLSQQWQLLTYYYSSFDVEVQAVVL